jgi:hypothetical protein
MQTLLWSPSTTYTEAPFEREDELESEVIRAAPALFGAQRIYLDVKKKIGQKGGTRNIPDGYLVDLTSSREPRLFVVEVELAKHEPLKHIAVQILEFSLSFETSQTAVKQIIRAALAAQPDAMRQCQAYATMHGHETVDILLERMIYGGERGRFNALVIIDDLDSDLERVLSSRFQFPVETLTVQRFRDGSGQTLLQFEPFLSDLSAPATEPASIAGDRDISELDTIVVPAHEEGFNATFLGENRWHQIRIHSSMLERIKHLAVYRVAPESAITHVARVASIERWKDTSKYVLNFAEPPVAIGPLRLTPKGAVKAPQAPRYTTYVRLMAATTLDEVF